METQNIPVIYQGTTESNNLTNPHMAANGQNPRTYVWVGKWRSQHVNGGGGLGAQAMGVLITATLDNYPDVFRCMLRGTTRYEPETKNKIGGLGAYRDLPPTQEEIDATIDRAMKKVERLIAEGFNPWAYLDREAI